MSDVRTDAGILYLPGGPVAIEAQCYALETKANQVFEEGCTRSGTA